MALRDNLRTEAQPYLQPGEQIHAVFLAQLGPSPYLATMIGVLGVLLLRPKHFIVVSTDRAHIVLTTSPWKPAKATGIAGRLPRSTEIGPLSGVWATSSLIAEKTRIHKRFHSDVEEADRLRGARGQQPARPTPAGSPAPGWYRDPHRPALQRYWDGRAWTEHTAAG